MPPILEIPAAASGRRFERPPNRPIGLSNFFTGTLRLSGGSAGEAISGPAGPLPLFADPGGSTCRNSGQFRLFSKIDSSSNRPHSEERTNDSVFSPPGVCGPGREHLPKLWTVSTFLLKNRLSLARSLQSTALRGAHKRLGFFAARRLRTRDGAPAETLDSFDFSSQKSTLARSLPSTALRGAHKRLGFFRQVAENRILVTVVGDVYSPNFATFQPALPAASFRSFVHSSVFTTQCRRSSPMSHLSATLRIAAADPACRMSLGSPVQSRANPTGREGLLSIDRSKATALLSTTPRSTPKSSASDPAPLSRRDKCPPARPGETLSRSRPRDSAGDGSAGAAVAAAPIRSLPRQRRRGVVAHRAGFRLRGVQS